MAIATSTMIALALAAAAAGTSYYNTTQTAKRQDNQLATSLRHQSGIQKKADERTAQEVESLKNSTSEAERAKTQAGFMDTLRNNKGKATAGLTPDIGSAAFKADSASAAQGVQQYGADTAGLMARIDAPGQQRQDEAFGYGNLGTDLNLIQREGQGTSFVDQLRLQAIKRSAGLDALSSFLGGAAGGVTAGAGGALATGGAGSAATSSYPGYTRGMGTGPY